VRVRRRFRKMAAGYRSHKIGWKYVVQRVAAWKGHAFWPGAHAWLRAVMVDAGFPDFLIRLSFPLLGPV
jgi:hypothetical protein